jgi:hypothetical protein
VEGECDGTTQERKLQGETIERGVPGSILESIGSKRIREATDCVWSGKYEPVRKGRAGSSGEIRIRKV